MRDLKDIVAKLKTNPNIYNLYVIGDIDSIIFSCDDIDYCFIAPHDDMKKYILRANPTETFDRWSTADVERYFDDADGLWNLWNDNSLDIYRELLDIYVTHYIDLES